MSKFRFRKMGLLVAASIIGATALVLPASPAGAVDPARASGVFGLGVATGFVSGNSPASLGCDLSSGYTFTGVAIAGATVNTAGGALEAVGQTGVTPPVGAATGDPYDGTPLGCGDFDLVGGVNVSNTVANAAAGVPLVGCPAGPPCTTGAGKANISADEGTVSVGAPFTCAGGFPQAVGCSLSGSFVRYGTSVLVFLTGCVDTDNLACNGPEDAADVVVVAEVVPLPFNATPSCPVTTTPGALFKCSLFSGPYTITPHGAVFADDGGASDPNGVAGPGGQLTQTGLDVVYCPLGTHVAGTYPANPDCDNS